MLGGVVPGEADGFAEVVKCGLVDEELGLVPGLLEKLDIFPDDGVLRRRGDVLVIGASGDHGGFGDGHVTGEQIDAGVENRVVEMFDMSPGFGVGLEGGPAFEATGRVLYEGGVFGQVGD